MRNGLESFVVVVVDAKTLSILELFLTSSFIV